MLSEADLKYVNSQRKYFIEDRNNTTLFQWLHSKGTNFSCYLEYYGSLDEEAKIENKIDDIRAILYALHSPLLYPFFYWTILIFILRKFNFKNKILRIILVQFTLRCTGDIINRFGDLMPRYFATAITKNEQGIITDYGCYIDSSSPERHPLRWFLTRQIGNFCWYIAEIFVDWYPLIRTREIVKNAYSIWYVYLTCILFNLSKIALIILHFFLSPSELYDKNTGAYDKTKVDMFYFYYWIIQLIIIYSSVIYDFSVFHVLRKYYFQISISQIGIVQKFKVFSIYRILVSLVISILFLPIISIAIILKIYYYVANQYHNLDFSFDEIRISIANMQYFIVFIDQILLSYSESKNKGRSTFSNNLTKSNDSDFGSSKNRMLNNNYLYKNWNDNSSNTLSYNYPNDTMQRNNKTQYSRNSNYDYWNLEFKPI